MLELLLGGGKAGKSFPDSGPGPKTLLAGSKDYGFFGEVSEVEMGLNSELLRLMSDTWASAKIVGQIKNSWFKFILNGRVLFFPRLPLAGNIPIADLYAMRAVFDVDEIYKPPMDYTTGQPLYQQNRYVSNNASLFKMRLMDSLAADYKTTTSSNYRPAADSEVAKLLMALCMPTYPDTLRIRTYAPTDFYVDNAGVVSQEAWVKEVFGSGTFAYNINATLNQCYYQTTNQRAWRPLLEYIPLQERADLLIIPENLSVVNEGISAPVLPSGAVVQDIKALSQFTNQVDSTPVAPSFSVVSVVLALFSVGGFATPENVVPTFNLSTDLGLYDLTAAIPSDYNGYITAS